MPEPQPMGYQYVARDGNYGDAAGLVFLPPDRAIDGNEDHSDPENIDWADEYGVSDVWVLVVDDVETEVSVHATEQEALAHLRARGGSDHVPDEDLIQHVVDEGVVVYLVSAPIPHLN